MDSYNRFDIIVLLYSLLDFIVHMDAVPFVLFCCFVRSGDFVNTFEMHQSECIFCNSQFNEFELVAFFFYLDPKLFFLPFAQILRCNPSARSTFAILQITNITNFKIDWILFAIQVIRSNVLCKNENMTLVILFQIIRDGNCSVGKFRIEIFDRKFWTGYFGSKFFYWKF